MNTQRSSLTLRITHPDGSTREATPDSEAVILGSGPSAAIHLPDARVSNVHVLLRVDRNRVLAIDLGSEDGTHLGDRRLESPQRLVPGDVLRVGSYQVRVLFEAERPATEPVREAPRKTVRDGTLSPLQTPPGMRRAAGAEAVAVTPFSAPLITPPPERPRKSLRVVTPMPEIRALTEEAPRPHRDPDSAVSREATVGHEVETHREAAIHREAETHREPAMSRGAEMQREAAVEHEAPVSRAAVGNDSAWKLLTVPSPSHSGVGGLDKVLQISLGWGRQPLAVEHFAAGTPVRVGERGDCAFRVPRVEKRRAFELARAGRTSAQVFVPAGARVRARVGPRALDEVGLREAGMLRAQGRSQVLQLGLRDSALIEVNGLCFVARFVEPSPMVAVRSWKPAENRFLGLMAASAVILTATFFALGRHAEGLPPDTSGQMADNAQYVQLILKRPAPKLAPKVEKGGAKEGARAAKEEGKLGKEEAKQEEAAPSLPGSPMVTRRAREETRAKVMKSGLVALLHASGGAASNVLGAGGIGSGINQALGGLKAGGGLTDARGLGGLGRRGEGTGGGGVGLGIGGLGTQGIGHGKGGYGSIDLAGKETETVRVVPGKTTVVGGLSKEVIGRVIKQHQSEIKYCYEAQLNQAPDLNGKVAVLFNIDGSGVVSDANISESTLGSSAAEQCMIAKIRRWRFPEPVGGGIVTVTFPWVFKPAAGGA